MNTLNVISIRENLEYRSEAIEYLQSKWTLIPPVIYEDCINACIDSPSPLPQWYLLEKNDEIIGCAGLITNDFISRMDLYPWICALYIDEKHRENSYARLLIEKAKKDCIKFGFEKVYLCTEHAGLYEKYGFSYIAQGYHPWDEDSRIYRFDLKSDFNINELVIRAEKEEELDDIYMLIKEAFKTAQVNDGDEQDFATNLRTSTNYVPELALVAEYKGNLIGHIMLTKTYVEKPDGSKFEALLLAPISVALPYRDKGIGSKLINKSFDLACQLGYSAIFLVGNPDYYKRFGFKQTSFYDIRPKSNFSEEVVLVAEIVADSLNGISGVIDCC